MTRLGLALGSGGARGLAHLGVLRVLEEEGLAPSCLAGTSMGSIVGALYAELEDAQRVSDRLWTYIENSRFRESWEPFIDDDQDLVETGRVQDFFRSLQKKVLTFRTFTSPSQQETERLREPLVDLFSSNRIEQLPLAFACVAIDLISGEPMVFRSGDLVEALHASSAIPGVFPPVEHKGRKLIDGGSAYRVPVRVCRELGCDLVIAVDIPSFQPSDEEYKRGIEVIMRSDAIARNRLNRIVITEADIVIRPDVARYHWANFHAAERVIIAGEDAARAALPEIRASIREWEKPIRRLRRFLSRRP